MVGKLEENHSYRFSKMLVCGYGGVKSLSFPKEGGEIKEVKDLEDVQREYDEGDLKNIS